MTDRNPLIHDAFQDDALPPAGREQLWQVIEQRQSLASRKRLVAVAGKVLLAGVVVAALLLLWSFLRATPDSRIAGPIAIAADSLSDPMVERPMIQDRQETPSSVIPLLGHRSSLSIDLKDLQTRQLQLADRLDETAGREHDVIANQLSEVEQQIEAAKIALSVVDAQLAGHQGAPVAMAIPPFPEPPQVIQIGGGGGIPDEVLYGAGGIATLLALTMVAMMGYLRRLARTTRQALSAVEQQVSSQHATLAAGIDAIAVEVERLGEGQRFMSKVLSGSEAKTPAR